MLCFVLTDSAHTHTHWYTPTHTHTRTDTPPTHTHTHSHTHLLCAWVLFCVLFRSDITILCFLYLFVALMTTMNKFCFCFCLNQPYRLTGRKTPSYCNCVLLFCSFTGLILPNLYKNCSFLLCLWKFSGEAVLLPLAAKSRCYGYLLCSLTLYLLPGDVPLYVAEVSVVGRHNLSAGSL